MEAGEEVIVEKAGGLGATMAVEDADEGGGGRSEDLTLVLERRIGLNNGDGQVTTGMRLQVHVPQQLISAPLPQHSLHLSPALPQHLHHPTTLYFPMINSTGGRRREGEQPKTIRWQGLCFFLPNPFMMEEKSFNEQISGDWLAFRLSGRYGELTAGPTRQIKRIRNAHCVEN